MRKAILAVSVGAASPEALAGIQAVERALAAAFPDRIFRRAFTGETLRRRLGGVPSPAEAVSQLRADAVEDILVQPLMLTDGAELEKLRVQVPGLPMGKPFLADCAAAAAILLGYLPSARAGTTNILVGHPGGEVHFARLERALGRGDILVRTVPQALQVGKAVSLYPLTLTCGGHALRDLNAWKERLETADHAVSCHFCALGERPGVQSRFVELAKEAEKR